MADSIPVVWPDDIKVDVLTPLMILRAQVEPLKRMTKGQLQVQVNTLSSAEAEKVTHSMDLVAPNLGNYRHGILAVTHSREFVYPAEFEAACFQPNLDDPEKSLRTLVGDPPNVADSEERFIELLTEVLRSRQVKSVIQSLLARIHEEGERGLSAPQTRGTP
jgi:hypothetical protein